MVAGNRSRYLAPLALAAVVGATVVVVTSGLGTSHHVVDQPTSALTSTTVPAPARHRHARFYVVQSGDTLSAIAAKTGVSLARIEALNSGVDPSTLQTGQRLKLGR